MKHLLIFLLANLMFFTGNAQQTNPEDIGYVIVIHGGAGYSNPENMSEELQEAYHSGLREALLVGSAILEDGGSAIDAIEQAIIILENNPLFNAGKGAVKTAENKFELDASIMDGKDRNAGAVAGVRQVKNPIIAARRVMELTPHVMFSGAGADLFAETQNLEVVPNTYFDGNYTPDPATANPNGGTVGAVALDKHGNLAAGTSTGGMTGKMHGRIGDSPVIGAGTFADNSTCAVSCTGHGEFFIRYSVAYDVHARMAYSNETLENASALALEAARSAGGSGGLIALDKDGNVSMPFNTGSMFRGMATKSLLETSIFR